jgi:hypothetical protein
MWNSDMSAAPKDGTNILVFAEGFDWPEVIRYEQYGEEYAEEIGEDGFWRYSEDLLADVAEIEFGTLTHWAPITLPAVA